MTTNKLTILAALMLGAYAAGTAGCELIAAVDRSKIQDDAGAGGGGGNATSSSKSSSSSSSSSTGGATCTGDGDCQPGSCGGAASKTFTPAQTCDTTTHTCKDGTPVDCSTSGKICDATAGCIGCNADADCAAASCNGTTFVAAETCDTTAHTCTAGAQTACTGATPLCSATAGCVACNVDADCGAVSCNGTMLTSAGTCSQTTHTCTAGGTTDCSLTGKFCNATSGCVDCNNSSQCAGPACNGNVFTDAATCDTTAHTCTAGANTSCVGATPACIAAVGCVECAGVSDCNAASCNGTTFHAAQTCNGSHQCAGGAGDDCATHSPAQLCDATNGCVDCKQASDCQAAKCTAGTFHPAETCSGTGTCTAGTGQLCTGGTPVCTAANGCVECANTTDCTAPAVCDTTTTHTCVECIDDSTCTLPATCNTTTHTCG